MPVKTTDFQTAIDSGRCGHHALEIGSHATLGVGNFYGWQGGHTNTCAAARTNKLIVAYTNEIEHHPPSPRILCGDLNCEPEDLPQLLHLMKQHHLVDIGKETDNWGGQRMQPTCKAPSAT